MTNPPPATGRLRVTHANHYLFSDYYLDHRARERPEWSASDAEARAALDVITRRWRSFTPKSDNEAQTENDWIRPVLDALGHHYNVQVSLQTPLGVKKPDYILFPTAAARQAAKGDTVSEADLRGALAVADAKAWDRPLDKTLTVRAGAGAPRVSENPGYQIDFYIRHAGLPWGLLTNGRQWRLYHQDSSKKLDVFYAVDLVELIEQADLDAFKYFYLFFRRAAFAPDSWLAQTLAESRAYEQGVSDNLKDQVYTALRELAQGLLAFPRNGLQPTPDTLQAVHDNSLIVLYRLLFTLYAESRDLLPVESNAAYGDTYSLSAIKRRVAQELTANRPAARSMAVLWDQLKQLWSVINGGDPGLAVPAYDGGLFDPEQHPFLEQYSVGDLHLRRAIDLLARTPDPKTRQPIFVDYRDLEVRHLGSIYEGLLEYQLRYTDVPLAARKDKGREVYLPLDPGAASGARSDVAPVVPAGEVYLATDKGERKATGSYYTPDYIVQYIVEHTVGPVLDALRQRHADDAALASAVLGVNVLDPAMGSGHFLVAVTDFIARWLVEHVTPAGAEAEGDLAYWRRRVAQACIYGVDLNPLAVELAKLSLWLATVARDKPLSFLDHHLRCGNSLIGARVADLPLGGEADTRQQRAQRARRKEQAAIAAGQTTMLDEPVFASAMSSANDLLMQIEGMTSETLADVRQAKRIFAQVSRDVTAKYRRLADVGTARHFGLAVGEDVWRGLAQYTLRGGIPLPQYERLLAEAEAIARARRFFHWELEFPEVFFDRHGRLLRDEAGFDAVVGNPPYVRQEELSELKPYFATAYPETYHGMADLFVYFFHQAIRLLRTDCRMSYISSNSWLQTNFAEHLRRFVRTTTTVETLIDLGNNRTFKEAPDVCPSIFVIDKTQPHEEHRFPLVVFNRGEAPSLNTDILDRKATLVLQRDQPDMGWHLDDDEKRQIIQRLTTKCALLGDWVPRGIFRGLITGLNEVFVIDHVLYDKIIQRSPETKVLLKPFLRGEDFRPWYQEDEGRWLIALPSGWTRERYGSGLTESKAWSSFANEFSTLADHLHANADAGRKRYDKGEFWWELRSCDYYDAFEGAKIGWPDIGKIPRFSLIDPGTYLGNTAYFTPVDDPFLLGFLQSRTAWLLISKICLHNKFRGGLWEYRLFTQFMARVPVPEATEEQRARIGRFTLTITDHARARHALHRRARRRILADLGGPDKKLNQKLTAWWEQDFPSFRAEVQKVFKHDIPLKQRDEWEEWLETQRAEHARLTAEIVRLETDLNARVYELFDLTPAEIQIIEASTKYRYGEV